MKIIFIDTILTDYDEGPDKGGPHAPYTQSERKQTYIDAAERLVELGHAYYDDTTPEQLHALRERQRAAKQPPRYDGRGRHRSAEEIEESRQAGLPTASLRTTVTSAPSSHRNW